MRFQTLASVLSLVTAIRAETEGATETEDATEIRTVDLPSSTINIPECTATSHTGSGGFFDLRPDMAVVSDEHTKKYAVTKDYFSKGYDYGKNFTLNICGAVVDPIDDVVGVDTSLWQNVSAYYMERGQVISIGSQSMDLQSRGRKLVLQYTGGSPCGEDADSTDMVKRTRGDDDYLYDEDEASESPVPEP
ncbi:hypothetical protein FZEAL_1415, partial [Fusarium zealandicum]